MNIMIIDDEINSIRVTKTKLIECSTDANVVGTFTDPIKALKAIQESKPDLLLLDIEMPGMNGFELLENLDLDEINVVFVTAYDKYAIRAIKGSAIDYLLKPYSASDLKEALDKTKVVLKNGRLRAEAMAQKRPTFFVIPGLREYEKVDLINIVYAEGQRGGYTKFVLKSGAKVMASRPLSYYEDILTVNPFIKIHKSHIINVSEMKKFNSGAFKVIMSNDVELHLAHRRKPAFIKFLKEK
ncbi:MAG: two-component system LytT family response regulator [bacterium]|jgi:two-component system LytT family response regulator